MSTRVPLPLPNVIHSVVSSLIRLLIPSSTQRTALKTLDKIYTSFISCLGQVFCKLQQET